MQAITTIGLDIAKSVFQVHGVDADGKVVIRRQLKRRYVLAFFQKLPPCLVGIEACASSHHWSRELQALGHTVRLMPPAYVKPYVKRQKNDAADAEAICEAVTRTKYAVCADQDARATKLADAASHPPSVHPAADLGDQCDPRSSCRVWRSSQPVGRKGIEQLLGSSPIRATNGCPMLRAHVLPHWAAQLLSLKKQILQFDRMIMAWHRSNQDEQAP